MVLWPGMYNTAFLVILVIRVKGHHFDKVVIYTRDKEKLFRFSTCSVNILKKYCKVSGYPILIDHC